MLKKWIDQGAPYKVHWAFVNPVRPPLPAVKDKAWVKNEIDAFILARLEQAGLKPSPRADKTTLIRRLSLDLRGVPPSLAEVDEFLADSAPDAYAKLVDRMLASPRYGEKMALLWLDLARFGDTSGFENDSTRQMWLWRDWVINAFNKNMPFDQFTIEQLAGDPFAQGDHRAEDRLGLQSQHALQRGRRRPIPRSSSSATTWTAPTRSARSGSA